MRQPLEDRVAIVTGAGGGIGRAVTRRLAALGVTVCVTGRRRESLESTGEGLGEAIIVCPLDLTSSEAVPALVAQCRQRFGGQLDLLVHCAGMYSRAVMEETTPGDLERQFEANVRAPYDLTRALLPMLKSARGQVVFVNSTQGLVAGAGLGQFAATQHALKAIADSLRGEVNDDGVRVVSLHVGRTATSRSQRVFQAEGKPYRPELLLQPEDVAGVVAFCLALPPTAEITSLNIRPMCRSY
jgi:NADP-dependent 3-hydroxy acid dehydrogenase YdfG